MFSKQSAAEAASENANMWRRVNNVNRVAGGLKVTPISWFDTVVNSIIKQIQIIRQLDLACRYYSLAGSHSTGSVTGSLQFRGVDKGGVYLAFPP